MSAERSESVSHEGGRVGPMSESGNNPGTDSRCSSSSNPLLLEWAMPSTTNESAGDVSFQPSNPITSSGTDYPLRRSL